VIVATATPTREIVRWAVSLGADTVCTLPYDAAEVRACIETLEQAA